MPRRKSKRARAVAPVFAVTDLGGGEAELVLYGDVVEDEPRDPWTGEPTGEQAVSTERVNRELDGLRGASHVTVRLNSCGGDYYTGLAIYNVLRSLDANVTVRIEGIAASAASVIACAGDEVMVGAGSILMVHEAAVGLMGYYQSSDLAELMADLDATNKSIAAVYAERTGKTPEECRALMAAETWMVGQEIVDAGFATAMDATEPAEQVEEEGDGELMVAGVLHDLRAYRNVPDLAAKVAASAIPHKEVPAAPVAVTDMQEPPKAAEEKGVEHMTLDELRAQAPELVAAIEAEAVQAERDRIARIDEIAGDVPADLVASAKYGEPCTAQELAYRAMVARKADHDARAEAEAIERRAFAAAIAADAAESGADEVGADPNGGADGDDEGAEEEQAKKDVEQCAALFNNMKGGVR